jgi:ethanolaminephosphotransferase
MTLVFVQRPISSLAFGVAALITSCLILLKLLFVIHKEVPAQEIQDVENYMKPRKLDEVFILLGILILVISMGSSSMIEEEHYIWHFLTSTISLLFFRKAIQSFDLNKAVGDLISIEKKNYTSGCQISLLFLVLFCGRILKGWHQGGVNWTNLPDISSWLEQAGSQYINLIQIASCIIIFMVGIFVLFLLQSKTKVVMVIGLSLLMSGLLVLQHFMKHQNMSASNNKDATLSVQVFYAILGITTVTVVLVLPWVMPKKTHKKCSKWNLYMSASVPTEIQNMTPIFVLKDSLYVIGCMYITFWCLLQLLLQRPINAMPLLLLNVQILAYMLAFSCGSHHNKQWVEVSYKFHEEISVFILFFIAD